MIPNNKKVSIHITTFKKEVDEMNQERSVIKKDLKGNRNTRFICSICLNSKNDENGILCPICQKSCDSCTKDKKVHKKTNSNDIIKEEPATKIVQTSKTNVAQGYDLLNEVLTVFQNKKQIDAQKFKSLKDKATSTETNAYKNVEKLSLSKIQQFSIEEDRKTNENCKFTIVNYCQPEKSKRPYAIDLTRHKSSSIPQMKVDELKKSLKEKTKSKDAIEEVNRMFANVRRYESRDIIEETNRPMTRNGPRVLPVVKTNVERTVCSEQANMQMCKCCQTKDYNMSSGDSLLKPGCFDFEDEIERCDKCVYRLCCHYQNRYRKIQTGIIVCKNCRNVRDSGCQHEKQSSRSDFNDTG